MKIAFFVPHITRRPGFENNVSAHVQLPCEIARRLRDRGHQVDILTDSMVEGYTMPVCLPEGIDVVPMAGKAFVTSAGRSRLPKIISFVFLFVLMALRIRKKVIRERYDVVHFFGTERILILSKLVSMIGINAPMVLTFNQYIRGSFFARVRNASLFWNHLRAVVVSMDQMKENIPAGIKVLVIRHGIIKDLSLVLAAPRESACRVLFWRTPDHLNGGDICIEVFRELAPLYPDVDFDLAIRAESMVVDLDAYEREVANGHVFRFPYEDGVTLESLLAGAICVFQPFREYTYHPQFVILESLMLGLPVVASDLPGITEMVDVGKTGYAFSLLDRQSAVDGIRNVLAGKISAQADIRDQVSKTWSWEDYEDRLLDLYRSLA